MKLVALFVLVLVLSLSIWAWRLLPGRKASAQFLQIWTMPWGRQLIVDFFGLEIVLALWMIRDALSAGSWISAIACIGAMPIFGSMAAAVYWLLRAF